MHYRICDRPLFEQVPSTPIYRWNKSNLPQLHSQTPRHNLNTTACCVVLPPYCKYARLDFLERKTYEAKFNDLTFLQCDCSSQGSWKKIVQSQCALKTKDSQVFFYNRTNKIQGSTLRSLKTLKPFDRTWSLGKQPSNLILNLNGPFAKKPWESLVLRNSCDWTIFFHVPRSE